LALRRLCLTVSATGNGIESLKNSLQDTEVKFCLITLRLNLEAVPDQPRNVFIHWKGPKASGATKVKNNQFLQQALELLSPNHGQLDALGKKEFTEDNIATRWHPSAGSHEIN